MRVGGSCGARCRGWGAWQLALGGQHVGGGPRGSLVEFQLQLLGLRLGLGGWWGAPLIQLALASLRHVQRVTDCWLCLAWRWR